MILYHGSPVGGLQILEPKFDPRLGIEGIFVSDEPFGPMMFSLLPESAKADVDYQTKDGEFISGTVQAPSFNKTGFLYTVEVPKDSIQSLQSGELFLSEPASIQGKRSVSEEEVVRLGWKMEKVLS